MEYPFVNTLLGPSHKLEMRHWQCLLVSHCPWTQTRLLRLSLKSITAWWEEVTVTVVQLSCGRNCLFCWRQLLFFTTCWKTACWRDGGEHWLMLRQSCSVAASTGGNVSTRDQLKRKKKLICSRPMQKAFNINTHLWAPLQGETLQKSSK